MRQDLDEPGESGEFTPAQIRAKITELQRNRIAPPELRNAAPAEPARTPKMTVDLGLGPREYNDTDEFGPRVVRGLSRMGDAMRTPAMLVNEGMNTATLGATRAGTDKLAELTGVRVGPGPVLGLK